MYNWFSFHHALIHCAPVNVPPTSIHYRSILHTARSSFIVLNAFKYQRLNVILEMVADNCVIGFAHSTTILSLSITHSIIDICCFSISMACRLIFAVLV